MSSNVVAENIMEIQTLIKNTYNKKFILTIKTDSGLRVNSGVGFINRYDCFEWVQGVNDTREQRFLEDAMIRLEMCTGEKREISLIHITDIIRYPNIFEVEEYKEKILTKEDFTYLKAIFDVFMSCIIEHKIKDYRFELYKIHTWTGRLQDGVGIVFYMNNHLTKDLFIASDTLGERIELYNKLKVKTNYDITDEVKEYYGECK